MVIATMKKRPSQVRHILSILPFFKSIFICRKCTCRKAHIVCKRTAYDGRTGCLYKIAATGIAGERVGFGHNQCLFKLINLMDLSESIVFFSIICIRCYYSL